VRAVGVPGVEALRLDHDRRAARAFVALQQLLARATGAVAAIATTTARAPVLAVALEQTCV
jgi:hypothetical protein